MSGGMITSDVSGKADVVMDTNGQMLYYNSGRQALDIGSEDDVMTISSGGLPNWEASTGGTVGIENVIMAANTTIGDYTTPSSATCSSSASATPTYSNATFGTWTATGSQVTESSNVITFDIQTRVTNNTISTDLGSTLSDSQWCLRCKLVFTTLDGAAASTVFLEVGMGDTDYNTAPDNSGVALDLIAMQCRAASGLSPTEQWGLVGYNSTGGLDNPEVPEFDTAPAVQTYYMEIIRTSTTNMTIGLYNSADFGVGDLIMPIESKTISSGVSGLQYLRVGNALVSSETSTGNTIAGTVEDFEIWDGVTSPSTTPCSNAVDDDTATYWQSDAETNPNIYVDMGSSSTDSNITIYPKDTTTETEIKIQSSPDAATWTDERTITVSNLTNAAYNYIRFNLVDSRYMRIYGNSGASRILAINEIKIKTETATDIENDHGHLAISSSDTSLNLDGT